MNLRGNFRWILNAGMVSALAVGFSISASAQNPVEQFFRFVGTSDATTANLRIVSSQNGSVNAGNYTVGRYFGRLGSTSTDLDAASDLFVYCTDINHTIGANQTYDTLINLGKVDAAPAERLRRLNYGSPPPGDDPASPAVFYMNNWKTDGSDPGLDLGSGTTNFTIGTDIAPLGGGLASALGDTRFPNATSPVFYNDYLSTSLFSYNADSTIDNAAGHAEALKRASMVSYLVDSFLNATTDTPFITGAGLTAGHSLTQYHAAVQVAIWEIVQDGFSGGTGWDAAGDVQRNGVAAFQNLGIGATNALKNTSGTALVQSVLDFALAKGTAYASLDNYWVQSQRSLDTANTWLAHRQDFAFTDSGPIPEPAFYQMAGLLTMGGVAFFRLRRKRK